MKKKNRYITPTKVSKVMAKNCMLMADIEVSMVSWENLKTRTATYAMKSLRVLVCIYLIIEL